MVKSWLKRLVLDQQLLTRAQLCMQRREVLFEPVLALPNIRRAGIVGPIREPQRDVPAAQAVCDVNALHAMLKGLLPDRFRGIAEGAKFVFLILKQVRIDGPNSYFVALCRGPDSLGVLGAAREIPQYVDRDSWSGAGERVDQSCIAELLFNRGRGCWLQVLAESCPCICKSPRWQFDPEVFKSFEDILSGDGIHRVTSSLRRVP